MAVAARVTVLHPAVSLEELDRRAQRLLMDYGWSAEAALALRVDWHARLRRRAARDAVFAEELTCCHRGGGRMDCNDPYVIHWPERESWMELQRRVNDTSLALETPQSPAEAPEAAPESPPGPISSSREVDGAKSLDRQASDG